MRVLPFLILYQGAYYFYNPTVSKYIGLNNQNITNNSLELVQRECRRYGIVLDNNTISRSIGNLEFYQINPENVQVLLLKFAFYDGNIFFTPYAFAIPIGERGYDLLKFHFKTLTFEVSRYEKALNNQRWELNGTNTVSITEQLINTIRENQRNICTSQVMRDRIIERERLRELEQRGGAPDRQEVAPPEVPAQMNNNFFTNLENKIVERFKNDNPKGAIRFERLNKTGRKDKTVKEFLKRFFEEFNDEKNTIFVVDSTIQTDTGRRRSIGDIYHLVKYYYPNATLKEIYQILMIDFPKEYQRGFRSSYCSTIKKYVWYYDDRDNATHNTNEKAEYGFSYNEIKRELTNS